MADAWKRGDTVELILHAAHSGLDISTELGELDSDFLPGLEQVDDMGDGRYVMSYTLSETNDADPGTHAISVTLSDWAGRRRTFHDLKLDYVSDQPIVTHAIDGLSANNLSMAPGDVTIKGKVTYDDMVQSAVADSTRVDHPQYANMTTMFVTTPVVDTKIEVSDECGSVFNTTTAADGTWQVIAPNPGIFCRKFTAKLYTTAQKNPVNVQVGSLTTHVAVLGSVTVGTSNVGEINTRWFIGTREHGAIAILMEGVKRQKWIKTYLGTRYTAAQLPRLNYVYDFNRCDVSPFSFTSSNGTVNICSQTGNRNELDDHIINHETFHWYGVNFMPEHDGNGSGSPDQAGGFGEGFATVMAGISISSLWNFKTIVGNAENMDFNGNFKSDGDGTLVAALPDDLYATQSDKCCGGWSWRILRDFFDTSPPEPEDTFTRYSLLGQTNPLHQDYGAFDGTGNATGYQDVIVKYLGGKNIAGNSSRPPLSRGFANLDMTEFLDGALCRGLSTRTSLEKIAKTVMDFRAYVSTDAPMSCP